MLSEKLLNEIESLVEANDDEALKEILVSFRYSKEYQEGDIASLIQEKLIYKAVQSDSLKVAKMLLKNYRVDVNSTHNNSTLLHLAVDNGNAAMVKILLKSGATMPEEDFYGRDNPKTALTCAIEAGKLEVVKAFIPYLSLEQLKEYNKYFLMAMSDPKKDWNEILETLINQGAIDLNIKLFGNATLFEQAAMNGKIKILETLVKYKHYDLDTDLNQRTTVLHWAALTKEGLDTIDFLLEYGANVNIHEGMEGGTPLHLAAKTGHLKGVEALLSHGAKVNATDDSSWAPLHWAAGRVLQVVQVLINSGANVNALTDEKDTPLHFAVKNKKLEAVKLLIGHGAKIDIQNESGKTPVEMLEGDDAGTITIKEFLSKIEQIDNLFSSEASFSEIASSDNGVLVAMKNRIIHNLKEFGTKGQEHFKANIIKLLSKQTNTAFGKEIFTENAIKHLFEDELKCMKPMLILEIRGSLNSADGYQLPKEIYYKIFDHVAGFNSLCFISNQFSADDESERSTMGG